MKLVIPDVAIIVAYFVAVVTSRGIRNTRDFFLAGLTLIRMFARH